MVIDTESRISYAELDETTRALAAAFIEAGVGKGTRVGLIMPNRVQWVQIAVALTRIGARAGSAEHPAAAAGAGGATPRRLRAGSDRGRGVPRPSLSRRSGRTCCQHHRTSCAADGLDSRSASAVKRVAIDGRRDGRGRHAQRHARHHVHLGKQRTAEGCHPLPRQRAGRRAIRSGRPLHRCGHPPVPADAVLLGGRLRQRCAVRPAGRRHARHRGDSPARDDAAPAGARARHAVPRVARPGRGLGTPIRLCRSRFVRAAAGQPGGAAATRPTRRARCTREVVRDDRVLRTVLRLSRRHRHAAICMGQLRQAVRRHGGSDRRPRHRRTGSRRTPSA